MIRTILAIAALVSVSTTALAQSTSSGIVVEPRARSAYVIYLDVTGKEAAEIRPMVRDASAIVCRHAPRTANVLDNRPTYTQICIGQTNHAALVQMREIMARRGDRPFEVAILSVVMR